MHISLATKVMFRRIFAVLASCAVGIVQAASFVPPEGGKTVDQSFKIPLPTEIPSECIAWHIKGVELDVLVVLDKKKLEQRAFDDSRFRTEIEKLIRAENKRPSPSGCVELEYAQLGYAILIFDGAIEAGSAVILDGNLNTPAEYVTVRYFATAGFGGHVTYQIQGQRPFRARVWWLR